MAQRDAPLSVFDILHFGHVEILEQRRVQASLEVAARDGASQNHRRSRLAHRLHGVQVGAVIVRVPRRVEIVVRARQTRVQRPPRLRLFRKDRSVVVGVLTRENFAAAAEYGKAIDQRILAAGQVCIQGGKRFFVETHASQCSLRPSMGWPSCCARFCAAWILALKQRDLHKKHASREYKDVRSLFHFDLVSGRDSRLIFKGFNSGTTNSLAFLTTDSGASTSNCTAPSLYVRE